MAVDETKLRLKGEQLYARASLEVRSREVPACRVSWRRSILHAESFLRRALEACTNRPLIPVDEGPM